MSHLNPRRTIDELKELRAPHRRRKRRAARRLHAHLGEGAALAGGESPRRSGAETDRDEAGNIWVTLRGASEKALLIGGHIDSVPNGGWLDGCLNVLAGVEILRRINAQYDGKPPVTVRLVDWADEEGARFGKSLFGSSACSGNLDMDEARGLDGQGRHHTARRAARTAGSISSA